MARIDIHVSLDTTVEAGLLSSLASVLSKVENLQNVSESKEEKSKDVPKPVKKPNIVQDPPKPEPEPKQEQNSETKQVSDQKQEESEEKETIKLEDIRALIAKKVEQFRPEIKSKLTSLGAPNVSALKPEHFGDMLTFLNSL